MISIIIPVYNGEKTIEKTIEAVKSQINPQEHELIVVDDGSTDNTQNILKFAPGILYIRQENQGPACARNRGFKESKGEWIFFTDADCMPQKDWIQRALKHFKDPAIGVVAGSYTLYNKDSLLARCIQKEIMYRHIKLMPLYPKSFGSYNFCVRRNVFEEVGGFNEQYRHASGEDNDLSYKILNKGYKIYFAQEILVAHQHTTELRKYLKEQFRHGFWRVMMYRDHPRMSLGDDYTFWKDMIEPPLILLILLSVILCLIPQLRPWAFRILASSMLFLSIMEIFYALDMTKKTKEAFFWSWVMGLRAWARTSGFLAGIPSCLLNFLSKKVK
ncbi:MAG: glycosyltransferase [Candidatus Omnitrophota bacterium]